MTRRERLRFQKFIDFLYKSAKNKKEQEGDQSMMPFIMMPPNYGGGQPDPLAFYKFVSEELEKKEKALKEAGEKKKEKKWYSAQFSFFQTTLMCLTIGLVGGIIQLQLLYAFKAMLLRVIQ